jgi:hypothetical protein
MGKVSSVRTRLRGEYPAKVTRFDIQRNEPPARGSTDECVPVPKYVRFEASDRGLPTNPAGRFLESVDVALGRLVGSRYYPLLGLQGRAVKLRRAAVLTGVVAPKDLAGPSVKSVVVAGTGTDENLVLRDRGGCVDSSVGVERPKGL